MTLARNRFLHSSLVIQASTIAELSEALSGPDDTYRVASVPVDVAPVEFARAGSDTHVHVGFFGIPGHFEVASVGVAWQSTSAYGDDRFEHAWRMLRDLNVPDDTLAMVGFAFDGDRAAGPAWQGFANTMVVVPLMAVSGHLDSRRLTVVLPPGRSRDALLAELVSLESPPAPPSLHAGDTSIESRPHPDAYVASVAEAVDAIRRGALDKVVLARTVEVRSDTAPRPFDLVASLRERYPGCYVFGWQQSDRAFIGASPELLVQRDGSLVRSHPLAGTTARGEGEEEDSSLAETLMFSTKDRIEHSLVVDDIARRLEPVTTELSVDANPSLRRLTHIQHLSSEISGRLSRPLAALEVAGLLHPTPAVGGSPRTEALEFIAKTEGFDRGWYSGGIGWTRLDGDGELALGLRCALMNGERSYLFAGNGIVGDSDPEKELIETRLKFRPMLELLTQA